jgi:hypothetical protein
VRLHRLHEKAAQGVVLRLVRNGKRVATKSFAVRRPRNGARVFAWRLPGGLPHGQYRVLVDATLASMGAQPGTRRAERAFMVRL